MNLKFQINKMFQKLFKNPQIFRKKFGNFSVSRPLYVRWRLTLFSLRRVQTYLRMMKTSCTTSTERTRTRPWWPSWWMHICSILPAFLQIKNELSIYKFSLSVCLSVCLYPTNVKRADRTDRAQIFCGTSRDHREGLWMIKIFKNVF